MIQRPVRPKDLVKGKRYRLVTNDRRSNHDRDTLDNAILEYRGKLSEVVLDFEITSEPQRTRSGLSKALLAVNVRHLEHGRIPDYLAGATVEFEGRAGPGWRFKIIRASGNTIWTHIYLYRTGNGLLLSDLIDPSTIPATKAIEREVLAAFRKGLRGEDAGDA